MATVSNTLFDSMFDTLVEWDDANVLTICFCSQEPTTYAEANATYMLAKTNLFYPVISFGTIADGTSGRKIPLGPVVAVTVTNTGTVTHIAVVNRDTSTLLFTIGVTSTSVTAGGKVSLGVSSIQVGDPT